ncbi:unnamed protein product [Sphacelaria rigidula]
MVRGRGEGAAEDSFAHSRKMSRGSVGHAPCALLSSRSVSVFDVFASVSSNMLYLRRADLVGCVPSADCLACTGMYVRVQGWCWGVPCHKFRRFIPGKLVEMVGVTRRMIIKVCHPRCLLVVGQSRRLCLGNTYAPRTCPLPTISSVCKADLLSVLLVAAMDVMLRSSTQTLRAGHENSDDCDESIGYEHASTVNLRKEYRGRSRSSIFWCRNFIRAGTRCMRW